MILSSTFEGEGINGLEMVGEGSSGLEVVGEGSSSLEVVGRDAVVWRWWRGEQWSGVGQAQTSYLVALILGSGLII